MAHDSARGSQLSLLLLELAALVLLVVLVSYHRGEAPSALPLVELPLYALNKIVLHGATETVTLERARASVSSWRLSEGEPAETRVVLSILNSLTAAKQYHRAPSRPARDLGFFPSRGRIELVGEGEPVVIELGAKNEFLGGTYVRIGKGPVLFTQDLLFDPELVTRVAFVENLRPNSPNGSLEQATAGELQ